MIHDTHDIDIMCCISLNDQFSLILTDNLFLLCWSLTFLHLNQLLLYQLNGSERQELFNLSKLADISLKIKLDFRIPRN